MEKAVAAALTITFWTLPIGAHALEMSACSLYQASRGDQVYQVAAQSGDRDIRYWVVVEVARNEHWLQSNGDLGRIGESRKEREISVKNTSGTFPAFLYVLGFSIEHFEYITQRTTTGDWTQWLVTEEDKSNALFDSRDKGGEFETTEDGFLELC
jgi:hypothetical protein